MPSWEIHNRVAGLFCFDKASSEIVNRLIDDTCYVHDLGRKVPKISLKMEFFDPESYIKACNALTRRLQELSKYPDLFYLHHAMDLLSLRMASAILIGVDVKDRKDCVIEGIKLDLNYIHYKISRAVRNVSSITIPAYRREELVGKLRSNYEKIVDMKELMDWVKQEIVDRRVNEDNEELGYIIKVLYEKLQKAKERWFSEWSSTTPAPLSSLPSHAKVVASEKARYFLGRLFQGVNKIAACRSRLFDYAFMYGPYSLEHICNELLSSNRGLGKEIEYAIANEYELDHIKEIVSQNQIISKLSEMPSTVIDLYIKILLDAVKIIEVCWGDWHSSQLTKL